LLQMKKMNNPHYFIKKDKNALTGLNTTLSFSIIDSFLTSIKQNRRKWKKDSKLYSIEWNRKEQTFNSQEINYKIISEHLRDNHGFVPEKLNLPGMGCEWMDNTLDLGMDFHILEKDKKSALTITNGNTKKYLGESFPIEPALDREGQFFSTFQPQLIRKIILDRNNLISDSHLIMKPMWILNLRSLINDSISLIDICLNHIYIKAEYNPEPNWKFDKDILGERHNRRFMDKLKWVKQITGNNLNIEKERKILLELKNIRNHLNHFDPPTLAITIEEATNWLNDVLYIGVVLFNIREALKVPVSTDLINFLLQRTVSFVPKKTCENRIPLNNSTGYKSSIWNTTE